MTRTAPAAGMDRPARFNRPKRWRSASSEAAWVTRPSRSRVDPHLQALRSDQHERLSARAPLGAGAEWIESAFDLPPVDVTRAPDQQRNRTFLHAVAQPLEDGAGQGDPVDHTPTAGGATPAAAQPLRQIAGRPREGACRIGAG